MAMDGASLHDACRRGDCEAVAAHLDCGMSIDTVDENDLPLLHIAADAGCVAMVEFLLDRGADPRATDPGGATTLHTAAAQSQVEVVRLLLDRRCDVDLEAQNDAGATALHASCQGRVRGAALVATVTELLNRGANIHARTTDAFTPLHVASNQGVAEIVELLLRRGAHVGAVTHHNVTALHYASLAATGGAACIRHLVHYGASVGARSASGEVALHGAALFARTSTLMELLDLDATPMVANARGRTPLFAAASLSHSCAVELLMAAVVRLSM